MLYHAHVRRGIGRRLLPKYRVRNPEQTGPSSVTLGESYHFSNTLTARPFPRRRYEIGDRYGVSQIVEIRVTLVVMPDVATFPEVHLTFLPGVLSRRRGPLAIVNRAMPL
jgi:hypothetical protein